jgi:hypothetical protein
MTAPARGSVAKHGAPRAAGDEFAPANAQAASPATSPRSGLAPSRDRASEVGWCIERVAPRHGFSVGGFRGRQASGKGAVSRAGGESAVVSPDGNRSQAW